MCPLPGQTRTASFPLLANLGLDGCGFFKLAADKQWALGSGPRYQILSHIFARCASQKTHEHARIARVLRAILACPCVLRAILACPCVF